MNCPVCSTQIEPKDQFCAGCGLKVEDISAKQYCRFCDAEIKQGQRFCTGCGESSEKALRKEEFCHNCNTVLSDNTKFCPDCGAQNKAFQAASLPEPRTLAPVEKQEAGALQDEKMPPLPHGIRPAARPAARPASAPARPNETGKLPPAEPTVQPMRTASSAQGTQIGSIGGIAVRSAISRVPPPEGWEQPARSIPTEAVKIPSKQSAVDEAEQLAEVALEPSADTVRRPMRRTTISVGDDIIDDELGGASLQRDEAHSGFQKTEPAEAVTGNSDNSFFYVVPTPVLSITPDFLQLENLENLTTWEKDESEFTPKQPEETTQSMPHSAEFAQEEVALQQTAETQKGIQELEQLILQLEQNEAELTVRQHPNLSAQTPPIALEIPPPELKKVRKAREKAEKQARKAKKQAPLQEQGEGEPPTASPDELDFVAESSSLAQDAEKPPIGAKKQRKGKGLRQFVYIILIFLVAGSLAFGLLYFFQQYDENRQQSALSSTQELERSLVDHGKIAATDGIVVPDSTLGEQIFLPAPTKTQKKRARLVIPPTHPEVGDF